MPELTDEEKQILELMKQLEARDRAQQPPSEDPPRPLPERFTLPLGYDDEGKPFPIEKPLPSDEAQAAKNREVIKILEEKLRQGAAPPPAAPDDGEEKRRR